VGARYGALSLLDEDGHIGEFLISGLSAEERAAIGQLPSGKGLLSVVLREGQRLCLADLTQDPRFSGFPPNHPPMHSLLAVPIVSYQGILGNLYVTEKRNAPMFSQEDQETLARFATQAALAIENARLHRRVQALAIAEERERIAHEMHDSLAQLLGYVNTKAQAAQELLRREQAGSALVQIGQLAEAARSAYADVRESILGLRTSLNEEGGLVEALRMYLPQWQDQSGVTAELVASTFNGGYHALPAVAELQLLRIVQEALANVRKHAHATEARVCVRETDGGVEVMIEDDGRGFDPADLGRGQFPRFGLATMRERAEAVGGRLEIESQPGRGTRVIARVPTVGGVVLLRSGNGGAGLLRAERP
jgi:signal transduction histidine kinase